ncbi:hypothetical protein B566_EDAN016870 [Ephemera danica]|nr:hypothetical protein B566_EDAN016870 [Ephemera danica]
MNNNLFVSVLRSLEAVLSRVPCFPGRGRVTRLATLWFLTLAAWALALLLIGADVAPPSGPLWKLALLSVLAKVGGWMAVQVRLPGLLGMLLVGAGLQAAGVVTVEGPYLGLVRFIRKASLVIIMMRAGLDLDPTAMRRLKYAILRLAVVVPNLIVLRSQGFGVAKGVPTLVLAVTGIEDAIAIAGYGILNIAGSLAISIVQGPGSVALGIGAGALLGILCRFIPDHKDPYVISLRIFVLLLGGLIVVLGSDRISMGGAGPLAVIVAAFFASSAWINKGWRVGENQVALTFGVIWQFFEPVVFGLVGAQLRVDSLDANTVGLAAACVLAPAVVRFMFTMLLLCGGTLNLKEKVFVALSWMAKATVQAVLGPAALDLARGSGDPTAVAHAQVVFVVSVLSILLTAPLGAVLIATTGPRLLARN